MPVISTDCLQWLEAEPPMVRGGQARRQCWDTTAEQLLRPARLLISLPIPFRAVATNLLTARLMFLKRLHYGAYA
jgi:hypothetical protein